jgi:hypothetical protein
MKTARFNMIAAFVLLTGFFMSGGCEKDENAKKIICDNLLKQGVADTNLLKGSWYFKYFAKTRNGKKIKNKNTGHSNEARVEFDSTHVNKVELAIYGGNQLYFTDIYRSKNHLNYKWNGSTYLNPPPDIRKFEGKLGTAVDKAICYVIKGNKLIFYYQVKDDDDNIVVFKKK